MISSAFRHYGLPLPSWNAVFLCFLNSALSCLIRVMGGILSTFCPFPYSVFSYGNFLSPQRFSSHLYASHSQIKSLVLTSLKSVPHVYLPDRFLFLDVFSSSQTHFTNFPLKLAAASYFLASLNGTSIFSESKTNFRTIFDTSFLLPILSNQWSTQSLHPSSPIIFAIIVSQEIVTSSVDFWSSVLIGL